ncbi:MAG: DUF2911 domain-containing protein [Longimicrobiales bacterium]
MRSVFHFHALGLALAVFGAAGSPAHAQECYLARGDMAAAAQRPSPLGETVITLGGQEAKVCYGRPSANDRTVMGELVPFGQPWRLGANEATAIHLPFAAEVGGVRLEPGSYSIYAVPGEQEWEIFLNRNFQRWGIPINDEITAENVGSFTRPAEATEGMVEQLTFEWMTHEPDMGHLVLQWERTSVDIPIRKAGM